jgi:transcriptional regulator with XRE-family HTH domain
MGAYYMLSIKELREMTGLTQVKFAGTYHIPLQTVKQWEASKDSKAYRTPPVYALRLLELTILRDIEDKMVSLILDERNKKSKYSHQDELLKTAQDIWG